jgi:ABC-type polysaccharide/polyol phosphate transport system ATPase subunit
MSHPRIEFEGVWKKFRRGERTTRFRRSGAHTVDSDLTAHEFWALRDVSFEVSEGQALGIIGPNGAGKSTALKLLTRIMRPTRGHCALHGRVGALIEVAAGFHPDLTGRENVFLQGAIMGMHRREVAHKLDDIVAFAGLIDFVDMPVKRYSTGMNARLGFAIAANLDPDVLVIDEVLAVGDMAFQQRCIERMHEFKRKGVAIVFVSHDLQAVASLCDNAVFLDSAVRCQGSASDVIHTYVSSALDRAADGTNWPIEIQSVRIGDQYGRPIEDPVPPGSQVTLIATAIASSNQPSVGFELAVYRSTDNLMVNETRLTSAQSGLTGVRNGEPFEIRIDFAVNLTRGHYHVLGRVMEATGERPLSDRSAPALLVVHELNTWGGVVNLDVRVGSVPSAHPVASHNRS